MKSFMILYFVDIKYSHHGHRYGDGCTSLEEVLNSIVETICDGDDESLEEVKKLTEELIASTRQTGYIDRFEISISQIQFGKQFNVDY